jgi:CheY-like chemotaxis protein
MNTEFQAAAPAACWKVLLVDDEPAVHEVSKLILSGLSFEGREIELLSAGSAAQARDLGAAP